MYLSVDFSIRSRFFFSKSSFPSEVNALDLIVGKPFSNGITASAPYVIKKGVSPVDFRGVVL